MDRQPIIIAHRGASGYLPEHTLEAKALAYAMGADFIEQDIVLTADDVPIVVHDIHLDTVTDVSKVFPDRCRADGRFYAADLTLSEVKQLRVIERIHHNTQQPVFPQRFPVGASRFEVATLAEEIELIQGLNKSTGRSIGIYPEIKNPKWHRVQEKDISRIVLNLLSDYGYRRSSDNVYLQCFDPRETQRICCDLKSDLKLIQLIGENSWGGGDVDYADFRTQAGLQKIAAFACGIGPHLGHVVSGKVHGELVITDLVSTAHRCSLEVHPYTFRADDLPEYATSLDDLLEIFLEKIGVEGVFTDFPDRAAKFLMDSMS